MRTVLTTALAMMAAVVAFTPAGAQPPPPPKANPPAPPAAAPNTPSAPTEIAGKSLDLWIKEISHRDPSVREQAISMILAFEENAKKALPALIQQARIVENDLSPKSKAIFVIGRIAPFLHTENDKAILKDAVDALTAALDSSQAIVRLRAAESLGNIGPAARASIGKLTQKVRDSSSWEVRKAICYALGHVGRDETGWADMRALNALMDAVDDVPSKEVRFEALQAIIRLGPPAAANIDPFKVLLKRRLNVEADKLVVIWVRVTMMRLDMKEINDANLSTIAKLMKSNDLDVKVQAARALGYIGPPAKPKLPELLAELRGDEPLMVTQVIWSIARMGHFAKDAVPSLQAIANNHKDEAIKAAAKAAVDEMNTAIKENEKKPPM